LHLKPLAFLRCNTLAAAPQGRYVTPSGGAARLLGPAPSETWFSSHAPDEGDRRGGHRAASRMETM
jgi:hypothetical protein